MASSSIAFVASAASTVACHPCVKPVAAAACSPQVPVAPRVSSASCSFAAFEQREFIGAKVGTRSFVGGLSFTSTRAEVDAFPAGAVALLEEHDSSVGRRQVLQSLATAVAGWTALAGSAAAFDESFLVNGNYKNDTSGLLEVLKEAVDAPNADNVKASRKGMNDYSARYRRDGTKQKLNSYVTMKTLINSLAGHYNNYGPNRPLPKKLKARVEQLFAQAEKALAREA